MVKSDNIEEKQPIIVFLSISLALFLAFIGFFSWHTARMRNYELNYIKMKGTAVDVVVSRSTSSSRRGSSTSYHFVFAYTYNGQEYKFTDRVGYKNDISDDIGKYAEIYVNPKKPEQAERVTSAPFISILCAIFFAFFCVTYSAGMNILLSNFGTSFKKRFLFVWGIEILLAVSFLLLFWLGLPNSGFAEVFKRINGAVGLAVISQLVLFATIVDATLSCKFGTKK